MINPVCLSAKDLGALEAGVVKITAKGEEQTKRGTGFIVQLSEDTVFIVTASHVVRGDNNPQVDFYTPINKSMPATVHHSDEGDPKGLGIAVLKVRGNKKLIASLLTFILAPSSLRLHKGDDVTVIGFPRKLGGPSSSVIKGSIVKRKGQWIVFLGAITAGNSGGPILKKGKVVGLVVEEERKTYNYAISADSIKAFLNGCGIKFLEGSQLTIGLSPFTAYLDKEFHPGILLSAEVVYGKTLGFISGLAPTFEIGTLSFKKDVTYSTLPGQPDTSFQEDNDLQFVGAGLKTYFNLSEDIHGYIGGVGGYSRETESNGTEGWYYNLVGGIAFYPWDIKTAIDVRYVFCEVSEKNIQFNSFGDADVTRETNNYGGFSLGLLISMAVW
jgi:hypothetical protein